MKKRVTCSIHNLLLQSVILSVSLTRGVESFDAIVTENELSRDFLSARIQYEQVDQIAPSMSTYRFRNVYNNNGTTFDKHSQSPLPMDAKEIVTSRWWRAIQNAEEKYDSVLQIVLLAPEWNGEAFSLAKEVESLARSGRIAAVWMLSLWHVARRDGLWHHLLLDNRLVWICSRRGGRTAAGPTCPCSPEGWCTS